MPFWRWLDLAHFEPLREPVLSFQVAHALYFSHQTNSKGELPMSLEWFENWDKESELF